ncbi:hypothetical protein [Mesorhizobium sp. CO1-1-8]|uniref:hypothetical protein n=1 Tax=Mesorhizobium sp. CO1-1-8 TaxID=2876631 RepID=UPI001CD0B17B|nr:hypothetical protein [Mesorhizobium sp. CO1-1-8]MBZ9774977.1 hypothetical protein [Mesorhizobium sp. CO1-1-8]
MADNLSRREEQRGTRRLMAWGVAVVAVIFVGLMAFFVLTPLSNGSWQTAPFKRAPEQNQGGNAPADTSPSPGVKKDPQENTEMPEQQQ